MDPVKTQHIRNDLRVQEKANIEVRDGLAIERTQFANERTFLAYMRTSMGFVLAGFSLIQFFRDQIYMWLGVIMIPAGIIMSLIGLKKFITKKSNIEKQRANYKPTSHVHAQVAAEARERSGLRIKSYRNGRV